MTNEFTTVFEISLGSNGVVKEDVFRLVIGSAVLVFGVYGIIRCIRTQSSKAVIHSAFAVVFSIVWLAMHMPFVVRDFTSLRHYLHVYRSGQCESAVGFVHVTGRQPYTGHAAGDKITVDGHEFQVDYFHWTLGYNKTIARGGVLFEKAYVRLHHHDGVILKVEVGSKETRAQALSGGSS